MQMKEDRVTGKGDWSEEMVWKDKRDANIMTAQQTESMHAKWMLVSQAEYWLQTSGSSN